jgi:Holliday junction DNA helicase RuvA
MFARLYGTILQPSLLHGEEEGDLLLKTAGGVAYRFSCSFPTRQRLLAADAGTELEVLTELAVREDRWLLYGFADAVEQTAFRLLTAVQGVGGKVALAILSVLPPELLQQAVLTKDAKALQQADGVGARLAERLITELKDRLAKQPLGSGSIQPMGDLMGGGASALASASDDPLLQDATQALIQLGYSRLEAMTALTKAQEQLQEKPIANSNQPSSPSLASFITAALQQLAKG